MEGTSGRGVGTISAEFLQNIQTSMDSSGVIGQVQVIETDEGPMTVIFMEEGADASALNTSQIFTDAGLTIGEGSHIQYTVAETGDASNTQIQYVDVDGNPVDPLQYGLETGDGTQVQYHFIQSSEDYAGLLGNMTADAVGIVPQAANLTSQDGNAVAVDPIIDLAAEQHITNQQIADHLIAHQQVPGQQSEHQQDLSQQNAYEQVLNQLDTFQQVPVLQTNLHQISSQQAVGKSVADNIETVLQAAHESGETLYITESGEIIKIDTSVLAGSQFSTNDGCMLYETNIQNSSADEHFVATKFLTDQLGNENVFSVAQPHASSVQFSAVPSVSTPRIVTKPRAKMTQNNSPYTHKVISNNSPTVGRSLLPPKTTASFNLKSINNIQTTSKKQSLLLPHLANQKPQVLTFKSNENTYIIKSFDSESAASASVWSQAKPNVNSATVTKSAVSASVWNQAKPNICSAAVAKPQLAPQMLAMKKQLQPFGKQVVTSHPVIGQTKQNAAELDKGTMTSVLPMPEVQTISTTMKSQGTPTSLLNTNRMMEYKVSRSGVPPAAIKKPLQTVAKQPIITAGLKQTVSTPFTTVKNIVTGKPTAFMPKVSRLLTADTQVNTTDVKQYGASYQTPPLKVIADVKQHTPTVPDSHSETEAGKAEYTEADKLNVTKETKQIVTENGTSIENACVNGDEGSKSHNQAIIYSNLCDYKHLAKIATATDILPSSTASSAAVPLYEVLADKDKEAGIDASNFPTEAKSPKLVTDSGEVRRIVPFKADTSTEVINARPYEDVVPNMLEMYKPIFNAYQCGICSEAFTMELNFKKHHLEKHTEKLTCLACNQNFKSDHILHSHMTLMHTVGKPLVCPVCSLGFLKSSLYWAHAARHASLFKCNMCLQVFNCNLELQRHMVDLHVEKNSKCVQCGQVFSSVEEVNEHQREQHGEDKQQSQVDLADTNLLEQNTECPGQDFLKEEQTGDSLSNQSPLAFFIDSNRQLTQQNVQPAKAVDKTPVAGCTTEQKQEIVPATELKQPSSTADQSEITVSSQSECSDKNESSTLDSKQSSVNGENKQPVVPSPKMKSIDVPDSDVTIQLYADGTLVTSDKSGTNYSKVRLEDLGLDHTMLQGNTNIELLIVQGDGKEVRAIINTNMQSDIQKSDSEKENPEFGKKSQDNEKSCDQPLLDEDDGELRATTGDPRPYKCSMCPRTFKFYRTFKCHEVVHTKAETYTCPLCKRLFARENNLKSHLQLHEKKAAMQKMTSKDSQSRDDKVWHCEHCGQSFTTHTHLQCHIRQQHEIKTGVLCNICDKRFLNEANVQRHLKTHVGPFPCSYCESKFDVHDKLANHINEHHNNKLFMCKCCNKMLLSKKSLITHISEHHGNTSVGKEQMEDLKKYECEECGSKFTKMAVLAKHKFVHVKVDEFKCNTCPKKFSIEWKLAKHQKTHDFPTMHKCPDCDEGFKFPHFLKNHKMSYHQGPYPCCECKEEFVSRLHLEDHQYENHEGGFSCAKCDKKLKNSLELDRHINTEHMITVSSSYLCGNCEEGFEHKPQLKTHLLKKHFKDSKKAMVKEYPEMRTVPDELTCDICDTYCKNRVAYKQHFKDEHFEGDTDAMYEVCPELRKFPDPADPVVCDHCGKSCTNLTYLNMHLKVHGIAVGNKEMTDRENSDSSSSDEGSDESDVDFTNIEPRDAEKLYECKECGRKFARQAALAKHIKSHEKDDLKEAIKNMLQEDLQRKDKLVKQTPIEEPVEEIDASPHAKSPKRRDSEMHICSVCHQVFNSKDELRVHRNADVCEKADDTSEELLSASKILFDTKKCECKSCCKVFANRHNLKRHLETIHKNNEIDMFSENFGTMTPSSTTLSAATKYSTENGCSGSNKKTVRRSSKSTDDGILLEDGTDISSFLGKNFNLEKTPSSQCNIASVKKKCHKCTICGEGFSREATLKKHLLLHDECNDSEFDMRPEKSHDSIADLQRALYPCVTCGNIYSTAGGLIYHSRVKHPEVDEVAVVTKINEITDMLNASKMEKIKGENKSNAIKKAQKRKLRESTENMDELTKKKIKLDEIDNANSGRQSLSGRMITKNSKYVENVKCIHCFKLFDDVSDYRRHVKAVHKGEQKSVTQLSVEGGHGQKCEHCDKTFLGSINLRRHLHMKHGISFDETKPHETAISSAIYNCDVCEQKFSSLVNLRNHMITVHDENGEFDFKVKEETFECAVCRIEFASKQKLDFHMGEHTGEKPYECSVCGKRRISKHKLELHLRKFHRKQWLRKIKCKICLFLFDSKHAMLKHKVTHRKLVEENDSVTTTHTNKCLKCDKVFKWKRNLVSHAKIFHKDSDPLTCGICNKLFPDKKSIKDHLKEHQEQKWTCETCKKCFSKKSHLNQHEAIVHKSCGNLSCDICKQSFVTKQKLLEHMLSHTSMMPHKCEICSTSFKSLHLLKAHKLRHNLKEKHKKLNLKSVKSDTNEVKMQVICKKCDRKFSTEWSLKVHVAKAHIRGNESKTCLKEKQNVIITTEVKEKNSANSEVNKSMLNVGAKDKIKSKDNKNATTKAEHESKLVEKRVAPSPLKYSDVKLKSPLMKKQSLITLTKKKTPLTKPKIPVIKLKSPSLKINTSLQKALNKQAAEIAHFASKPESNTQEAEMSIRHCETCNLDFASYKLYQKHMKHTHNISEFQSPLKNESDLNDSVCPLCHSVFSHRGNLKRHLEVLHNDEFVKPLNTGTKQVVQCVHCSECNKVFWYKDQFELHLNETHENNTALQLNKEHPEGVKKEVMDANHLLSKRRQPSIEETRQKCEFCSKIHWTKKAFENHILKCHPEHAETYGLQGGLSELKPEIELVDDSEETNKYISGHLFENMSVEKLSAYPVVMIERMPYGMALVHPVATQSGKLQNNEIKNEVYLSVGKEEHDNSVEMTVKCDPDEYKFDGTITTNDDEHTPDLNKKTEDATEKLVIENVRHIDNTDNICENEEADKFTKSLQNEEKINVQENGKFKAEDEFNGKIDSLNKIDIENIDIFQTSNSVKSLQTGSIQKKPKEGMNEIGNDICDVSKDEKCVLDVVHERNIFEMYGRYDFQQARTDKYSSEVLQNHLCNDMDTPKDSENKFVSNTCEQKDNNVKEEIATSEIHATDLKEVNTDGDNDKHDLEIDSESKGIVININIEPHEHISNDFSEEQHENIHTEMTTDDVDDKRYNVDSVEDIEQMDMTESDIASSQSNSNLRATDKVSETQEEVDGNSKNLTIVALGNIEKNYVNIDSTAKSDNEEENSHLLHTDSSGFNAENKMDID